MSSAIRPCYSSCCARCRSHRPMYRYRQKTHTTSSFRFLFRIGAFLALSGIAWLFGVGTAHGAPVGTFEIYSCPGEAECVVTTEESAPNDPYIDIALYCENKAPHAEYTFGYTGTYGGEWFLSG